VFDATSLIGATSGSIEQILDNLKSTSNQYVYYGCPKSDNAADTHNAQAVAYVLAIDHSLKQENMLVMRLWWRLDQQNNPQPHIYEISLGSEAGEIKTNLAANNNQCGLGVLIPPSTSK
jgi:hypothetical protein